MRYGHQPHTHRIEGANGVSLVNLDLTCNRWTTPLSVDTMMGRAYRRGRSDEYEIALPIVSTGKGDHYHAPGCPHGEGTAVFTAQAIQLGRKPCSVCRPDTVMLVAARLVPIGSKPNAWAAAYGDE